LGCTAIELVSGKPPYFELSTAQACFRMVEDPHPPYPPGASALFITFLEKCFVKEVEQRASAKELLQHDWLNQKKKAPAPVENVDRSSEVVFLFLFVSFCFFLFLFLTSSAGLS
jgi:serine/threonine protein kinase